MEKLKELIKTADIIKESEILKNLPPDRINDWNTYMRGRTCPIIDNGEHGVYSWDVVHFIINSLEKYIK